MAYTAINKYTDYFKTKLYTGTGSNGNAITGVGFQPDFLWIKDTVNVYSHRFYDAIRGVNSALNSDNTAAASQYSQYGQLTSFDSDGFTVGQGSSNGAAMNDANDEHCSWNWKANGTGSSNSDGSVTSTVSASTAGGFSIVTWTGTGATATIGHGLGVKPEMIWIKNTGAVENWIVYHKSIGSGNNLKLNLSDAQQDTTGAFNDTDPTTSVFTVHTNTNANQSGQLHVAYCFASKKGYSKVGNYIGSGETDGPFVYTGFAPQFVLFKRSTGSAGDWQLWDRTRDPFNPTEKAIHPNAAGGASTDQDIDMLSNGFKIRSNTGHLNNSTTSFPYLAIGQTMVGTNDTPVVAR